MRRLEVALIEYRESLEERGIKNLEEIEKKVLMHRKRLQVEYGLSESSEDGQGSSKLFLPVFLMMAIMKVSNDSGTHLFIIYIALEI